MYDHSTCMYYDRSRCIMSYRAHVRRNSGRWVWGRRPIALESRVVWGAARPSNYCTYVLHSLTFCVQMSCGIEDIMAFIHLSRKVIISKFQTPKSKFPVSNSEFQHISSKCQFPNSISQHQHIRFQFPFLRTTTQHTHTHTFNK